MRERTPCAKDTPQKAPSAPSREASWADAGGLKVNGGPLGAAKISPGSLPGDKMVASAHELDDPSVNHPASASSERQQGGSHGCKSSQSAQDKRSRLSNVINNLRKKVPEPKSPDGSPSPKDDRTSVERNLETLEKYVMTVLNGVIEDEEAEEETSDGKKEPGNSEKSKDSGEPEESAEEDRSKVTDNNLEPSKPTENGREAAVPAELPETTKDDVLENQKDNGVEEEDRLENGRRSEVTDTGGSKGDQSGTVDSVENAGEPPKDAGGCKGTSEDVVEEKKESRSLSEIILDRLSDQQTSIEDHVEDKFTPEDNAELRAICRDLLDDLVTGINCGTDGNDQLGGTGETLEGSQELQASLESLTSLHCSLPLDKVAPVLQNCTSDLAPQAPTSPQPATSAGSTKTLQKSSLPKVSHLCLYCDRKFLSISLRQRHTERVHQLGGGRRSERNSRRASQNCQYCSDRCADSLESLFQHMVHTHADKYHACLQCTTRYLTKDALLTHTTEIHQNLDKNVVQEKAKEALPVCKDATSSQKEVANPKDRKTEGLENDVRSEATNPCKKEPSNSESSEFDSSFYSSVSCNIRENLLHHLDGKLHPCPSSPPPPAAAASSLETKQQNFYDQSTNQIQLPIDISLTAATPVYNKEYNEEFLNSSKYAQKPGKSRSHPRRVSFEKYNFPRKYDGREQWTCSIKDLSKFDIYTQLTLRKKQQKLKDSSGLERLQPIVLNDQEAPGQTNLEEKLQSTECNRVDSIAEEASPVENTDRRCSNEDRKTSENGSDSFDKNELSSGQISCSSNVPSPSTICSSSSSSSPSITDTEFSTEFAKFMMLRKWSEKGKQDSKNQQVVYAELTGEWSRPRVYICGACNAKHVTLKEMEDHKSSMHPNVWCSHFEFSGDQRELYKHLFLPGRSVPTAKARNAILSERICTKCSKICVSLAELHRHMLECGGDQAWLLGLFGNGKKKCKWRPFGSRSRRRRQRGMKRNIQNSQTPKNNNVPKEKPNSGPRVRPSDRESIQKMLANLPPKRATRKVLQESQMRVQGRLRNMQTRSRPRIEGENSTASRISRNKAVLRNKLLKNAKSIQRHRCRSDNLSAVIESVVNHVDPRSLRSIDGQRKESRMESERSRVESGAVGKRRYLKTREMLAKIQRGKSLRAADSKSEETTKKRSKDESNESRSKVGSPPTPKRKRNVDPIASLNASLKAKSQLRTQDGKFAKNPNKDSPRKETKSPEQGKASQNTAQESQKQRGKMSKGKSLDSLPRRTTRLSSDSERMPILEPVNRMGEEATEKTSDLPILSPALMENKKTTRMSLKMDREEKKDPVEKEEKPKSNRGRKPKGYVKPLESQSNNVPKVEGNSRGTRLKGRKSEPLILSEKEIPRRIDSLRSTRSNDNLSELTKDVKRVNRDKKKDLLRHPETRSKSVQEGRLDSNDETIKVERVPMEVKKLLRSSRITRSPDTLTKLSVQSRETITKRSLRQSSKSKTSIRKEILDKIEPDTAETKVLLKKERQPRKSLRSERKFSEEMESSTRFETIVQMHKEPEEPKTSHLEVGENCSREDLESEEKEESTGEKEKDLKSMEKEGEDEIVEDSNDSLKKGTTLGRKRGRTKVESSTKVSDDKNRERTLENDPIEEEEPDKDLNSKSGKKSETLLDVESISMEKFNSQTMNVNLNNLQLEMGNSNIDSGKENTLETSMNAQKLKASRPRKSWGTKKERTSKRSLSNVIGILTEGVNIPVEVQQSVVLTMQTVVDNGNPELLQSNLQQPADNNATESSNEEIKSLESNAQDVSMNQENEGPSTLSNVRTESPSNDIILDLSRRKPKGKGSFLEKIVSKIAKQKDALLEGEVGSLLDNAADELTSILDEVGPALTENPEISERIDSGPEKVDNSTDGEIREISNKLEDEPIKDVVNIDEANDEVGNENMVNKEVANEEVTNEEVTSEKVVNEEVANEEVANEEMTNEEMTNKDVAKEEASNEEVTEEKTVNIVEREILVKEPNVTEIVDTSMKVQTENSVKKSKKKSLDSASPRKNKRKCVDKNEPVEENPIADEQCIAEIMKLINGSRVGNNESSERNEGKLDNGEKEAAPTSKRKAIDETVSTSNVDDNVTEENDSKLVESVKKLKTDQTILNIDEQESKIEDAEAGKTFKKRVRRKTDVKEEVKSSRRGKRKSGSKDEIPKTPEDSLELEALQLPETRRRKSSRGRSSINSSKHDVTVVEDISDLKALDDLPVETLITATEGMDEKNKEKLNEDKEEKINEEAEFPTPVKKRGKRKKVHEASEAEELDNSDTTDISATKTESVDEEMPNKRQILKRKAKMNISLVDDDLVYDHILIDSESSLEGETKEPENLANSMEDDKSTSESLDIPDNESFKIPEVTETLQHKKKTKRKSLIDDLEGQSESEASDNVEPRRVEEAINDAEEVNEELEGSVSNLKDRTRRSSSSSSIDSSFRTTRLSKRKQLDSDPDYIDSDTKQEQQVVTENNEINAGSQKRQSLKRRVKRNIPFLGMESNENCSIKLPIDHEKQQEPEEKLEEKSEILEESHEEAQVSITTMDSESIEAENVSQKRQSLKRRAKKDVLLVDTDCGENISTKPSVDDEKLVEPEEKLEVESDKIEDEKIFEKLETVIGNEITRENNEEAGNSTEDSVQSESSASEKPQTDDVQHHEDFQAPKKRAAGNFVVVHTKNGEILIVEKRKKLTKEAARFFCDVCATSFTRKSSLKKHNMSQSHLLQVAKSGKEKNDEQNQDEIEKLRESWNNGEGSTNEDNSVDQSDLERTNKEKQISLVKELSQFSIPETSKTVIGSEVTMEALEDELLDEEICKITENMSHEEYVLTDHVSPVPESSSTPIKVLPKLEGKKKRSERRKEKKKSLAEEHLALDTPETEESLVACKEVFNDEEPNLQTSRVLMPEVDCSTDTTVVSDVEQKISIDCSSNENEMSIRKCKSRKNQKKTVELSKDQDNVEIDQAASDNQTNKISLRPRRNHKLNFSSFDDFEFEDENCMDLAETNSSLKMDEDKNFEEQEDAVVTAKSRRSKKEKLTEEPRKLICSIQTDNLILDTPVELSNKQKTFKKTLENETRTAWSATKFDEGDLSEKGRGDDKGSNVKISEFDSDENSMNTDMSADIQKLLDDSELTENTQNDSQMSSDDFEVPVVTSSLETNLEELIVESKLPDTDKDHVVEENELKETVSKKTAKKHKTSPKGHGRSRAKGRSKKENKIQGISSESDGSDNEDGIKSQNKSKIVKSVFGRVFCGEKTDKVKEVLNDWISKSESDTDESRINEDFDQSLESAKGQDDKKVKYGSRGSSNIKRNSKRNSKRSSWSPNNGKSSGSEDESEEKMSKEKSRNSSRSQKKHDSHSSQSDLTLSEALMSNSRCRESKKRAEERISHSIAYELMYLGDQSDKRQKFKKDSSYELRNQSKSLSLDEHEVKDKDSNLENIKESEEDDREKRKKSVSKRIRRRTEDEDWKDLIIMKQPRSDEFEDKKGKETPSRISTYTEISSPGDSSLAPSSIRNRSPSPDINSQSRDSETETNERRISPLFIHETPDNSIEYSSNSENEEEDEIGGDEAKKNSEFSGEKVVIRSPTSKDRPEVITIAPTDAIEDNALDAPQEIKNTKSRQGKVLNFDEELFVECCSRLKATTETELRGAKKIKLDHSESYHKKEDQGFRTGRDRWRDVESQNSLGSLLESVNQLLGEEMYSSKENKRGGRRSTNSSRSASPDISRIDNLGYEDSLDVAFEDNNKLRDKIEQRMRESENLIANTFSQKNHNDRQVCMEKDIQLDKNPYDLDSGFKGKMNSLGGLLDKALSNLLHSNGKHDHNGSTPMKVLAELACARAPTSTTPEDSIMEGKSSQNFTKDPIENPSIVLSKESQLKKIRNPIKELFERKKEMKHRKLHEKTKSEAALRELNVQKQRKTKKTKKHPEFPLIRRNEHLGGLAEKKKRRDGFDNRKEEYLSDKIKDVYDFDDEESQVEQGLGSVLSYRNKEKSYEGSEWKKETEEKRGKERSYENNCLRSNEVDIAKLMSKAIGDTLENGKGDPLGIKLESMIDRKFKEMEKFVPKTKGALKSFQGEEVTGPMDEYIERKQTKRPGEQTKLQKLQRKQRSKNLKKRARNWKDQDDSSDEFRTAAKTEDIGVGISKSQRTCSKGKQNLFAEMSSSESEFEEEKYEVRNPSRRADRIDDVNSVLSSGKYEMENEENIDIWAEIKAGTKRRNEESETKKSESENSENRLVIDEHKEDDQRNSEDDIDNQSDRGFELDDLYREDSSVVESDPEETEAVRIKEDEKRGVEKLPEIKNHKQEEDLIPLEEALDLLDQSTELKAESQLNEAGADELNDDFKKSIIDENIVETNSLGQNDEREEDIMELPEKLSSNEKPQEQSDNLPLHVFLSRKVQESKKRKQQQLRRMQEEQERILMDLQPTRRQRKCAIGKQGLLAEISSSDEEVLIKESRRKSGEKLDYERQHRKPKRESKEKRKERYIEKKHEQIIAKEQKAIEEEILRELGKKKDSDEKSDRIMEEKDSDSEEGASSEKKKHQQKKRFNKDEEKGKQDNEISDAENNCEEEKRPVEEEKNEGTKKKLSKSPTRKKPIKVEAKVTAKKNKTPTTEKKRSLSVNGKEPKERRSSSGRRESDDEELKTTKSWNKVDEGVGVAIGRRKRAAANQLYYWSSSSDEEEIIETAPTVEEEEDDRQEQHGWIVGDSHKRMITMLAMEKQLKEKRRRSEDEFEPGKAKNKKHRNSTS
ncbi:titin homolog isoform X2 [Prorops nasuta]|uniref:titin homolog isoform X2 n=1 Tax=Prorops nasuta TaxID=863751 RepID=UPI0034CFBA86